MIDEVKLIQAAEMLEEVVRRSHASHENGEGNVIPMHPVVGRYGV